MQRKEVSKDDVQDVTEMTRKLEDAIGFILSDNEMELAVSALMSATINTIFGQCESLNEVYHYRSVVIKVMDLAISGIKISDK